ncbi:MAG: ATP-dependent DNA helicase RecQ [Moorea sp. SIO3C2]|nr:ATP-dependent DNA helicase RecQ [Moorena sp. SIO3C2]
MSELLLWQLAYHLSGSTLLGITEQEPLGSLPILIRTATLKTVKEFKPDAIDLRLNQKSPLDFAEGEYEWVENCDYKSSLQFDTIEKQDNNSTDRLLRLLQKLPERYPTYQQVALELLRQAVDNGKSHLAVADFQPSVATFALAVLDTVALVERVALLYGLPVILPKVEIYLVGSIDPFGVTQLLHHYRGVDLSETTNRIDSCQTSVGLVTTEELPKHVDFVSAAESLNSDSPPNSHSFNDLEKIADDFVTSIGKVPPLQAYPVSFERPTLDYFARRYFLIAELKPEQVKLIQKALRNESILGLLPTGFGKSLIFQLYGLLIPRTTLVISPLNALIRDQVHNLNRIGLKCVESITSSDSAKKKKKDKLENFNSGLYRLLYISPERLQISEFYNHLKAKIQESPVGALVIDEAHCVSEWGHDFRPAYLQIERLQQTWEDASGLTIPIIALTATASEPVRKDIMRVLRLSQESIVTLPSSDRSELSLSVHIVDKPENKPKILTRLIQEVVPQVLDISFEELIPNNQNFYYPHAGVVFGIYASPQGRQTIVEGVHHIAYALKKNLISDGNLVQVHASGAPGRCPECDSTVLQNQQKESCKCIECGALFQKSDTKNYSNTIWTKHIQEQQDKFQNNKFPLLVATKGYGMGIDKGNIRFIIHHSLSSSLEAYYQEAGRAGRDKKHAHVALMYHAPHLDCQKDYIDKGVAVPPPCVSEKKNFIFWKCPYFETHLCDYGHQARLIRQHYPGLEDDVKNVLEVYKKLISGEPLSVKGNRNKINNKNNQTQLGLYRLQQLGIVRNFSLKYKKLSHIEYQVFFIKNWTLEQIASSLKKYLVQRDIENKQAQIQVNQVLAPFSGQSIESVGEQILIAALNILIGRIYNLVLRMRYQMLRNQIEYAKSHESNTCRRIVIRGLFDYTEHLIDGNYKCGFCDVCNPSLKFDRDKAEILIEEAQIDEITNKLLFIFKGFDVKALQEILRLTIEREATVGLFARATNRLERDPTNLAALYLAGALARQRPGREMIAFDYLKFGFNEGINQGLSPDNLLLFYEEAVQLNAEEAFNWLTQVGGYWDNEEGLQFLIQEAAKRFGIESKQHRILLLLWQVKKMNDVGDDFINLKPEIETLKQGFEQLS